MDILFVVAAPDLPAEIAGKAGTAGPASRPGKGKAVPFIGIAPIAEAMAGGIKERGWRLNTIVMGPGQGARTQKPDLIVNCICDPTFHVRTLEALAETVEGSNTPVLNHPRMVLRTGRVDTASALTGQDGARFPLTTEYDREAGEFGDHLERYGHTLPVVVRPIGTHGGKALVKIEDRRGIPAWLAPLRRFVVTDFVDYAGRDGLYRKYRVVYVNGRLIRRHFITSDEWKIVIESRRFMAEHRRLIEEEKAFIGGQGGGFEDTLVGLFRALSLDFGAADFAIGEDGAITIFEINPCFQITGSIPPDKRERWGYLEDTNQAIVDALLEAAAGRAGGGG